MGSEVSSTTGAGGGPLGLFLYSLSVCGLCPELPALVRLSGHLLLLHPGTFPSSDQSQLTSTQQTWLTDPTSFSWHSLLPLNRACPSDTCPWGRMVGEGKKDSERVTAFCLGGGGAGWRLSCEFVLAGPGCSTFAVGRCKVPQWDSVGLSGSREGLCPGPSSRSDRASSVAVQRAPE